MAGEELPAVGDLIGGYRLDRLIATGGMGAVFAATHAKLGRRAAVKVLDRPFANDREYVSRFLHEARIANEIRHPNIVDIYDFIESDDRIALVMELLEGPTLSQALLELGRFSPVQALNIAIQLTDALSAVHARGVVHRDLKPANIVILQPLDSEFWEVPSFKVLDFGIAKQSGRAVDHRTTRGALLGTPAYMAPEQVANEPVSPATDLYAIGELLFEMVSGRRLFDGEQVLILTQKLKNELPSFEMPKDIPCGSAIASLARACVDPVPERRPTMIDLRRALTEILEEVEDLEGTEAVSSWKPSDSTFDDGAQTVLAMEAPKSIPDASTGPGMSTQMFFDRILEDINEINQPEPPPPPLQIPEPQKPLLLINEPTPPPPRPPSMIAPAPPVIVGTPLARGPSVMLRPIDRRAARRRRLRRSERAPIASSGC